MFFYRLFFSMCLQSTTAISLFQNGTYLDSLVRHYRHGSILHVSNEKYLQRLISNASANRAYGDMTQMILLFYASEINLFCKYRKMDLRKFESNQVLKVSMSLCYDSMLNNVEEILQRFLSKLKHEISVSQANLIEPENAVKQTRLEMRLNHWTTKDLTLIISLINLAKPDSCYDKKQDLIRISPKSFRYNLRTVSLKEPKKDRFFSIIEQEIVDIMGANSLQDVI